MSLAPFVAAAGDLPLKRIPMFTYVVDYEASWSPDGRRVVLVSNRHGGMHVHVMSVAAANHGSNMTEITRGDAEDDSPALSPDGRQIAYVSAREGRSHIYLMSADGTAVRQLTRGSGDEIHPAWAPDGSRILFDTTLYHQTRPGDASAAAPNKFVGEKTDDFMELATMRPDGSGLRRITSGGGYTYASFSPDGRFILYRRQQKGTSRIFLMDSSGRNERNLSGAFTSDGWPSWSPDGRRIVFSRHVGDAFQIFVMNRDGSSVHQLTAASGDFTNPRWSPDGKAVLCGRRWGGGVGLVLFRAPVRVVAGVFATSGRRRASRANPPSSRSRKTS